ncbi:MAG: single-stranded-DNA-specific exonuclease RecJ [Gammaproteobacteria bacterium]|nr:single-stranded-DNA-specific exonuclease RecJ [Gammaproteobacteria bacterium]
MRRVIQRRLIPAQVDLPGELHPLLRRIYAGRNVKSGRELDYSLDNLHPYRTLSGVETAAQLIAAALESGRRLMIVADYDADGATACALGLRALRAMGASVDYLVPDRFKHGYGLTPEIVELALPYKPDLLMTVDNGISSLEGVQHARAKGIDVIITDHHLPGPSLPAASAIVNPNLQDDAFPSKCLAGVGVMFYVLAALRALLRSRDWFQRRGIAEPNLAGFLDLVALGTVADMVPMDYNNRVLVEQGLQRIRAGRCSPGVSAMLEVANRSRNAATANDLAYFAGPRLNAAGRLTDMRLGIECLTADDPAVAAEMAAELDSLNRERRQIQAEMQHQALADLPSLREFAGAVPPRSVCIYNESWHAGVVGVLASQIRERVQCPVIAFARESEGMLKGSGRSVDGIHMRDVLANIANRHPELIRRFGGHAMAAGLSLDEGRLPEFTRLFEEEVGRVLPEPARASMLLSDGALGEDDFTVETAELLRRSGPWGQAFPEPLFDGEFDLLRCRTVVDRHLKFSLAVPGRPAPIDAIAFNRADSLDAPDGGRVHVAYRLDINEYRGRRSVQLIVEEMLSL